MNKLFYCFIGSVLLLICCTMNTYSQSLKDLSKSARDSIMLESAKKIILEFGDERYYTEHINVKISRIISPEGANKGRAFYKLTYEYDTTKYKLEWNYLVEVYFWEDTGAIEYIAFGNGCSLAKENMEAIRDKQKKKNFVSKVPFKSFLNK